VKPYLNGPARVRGSISLAPILVISALAAIVTLPGIYRASSYQVINTNTLFLAENYNDTNAELFSQRNIYGTPTLLGPVMESPTKISTADYISAPNVMDAEIVAIAGETFCPGSSLKCVNYEIRVKVENPNMIAESTQKIGIQIVKP
jgi:hypothetical protein